VGYEWDPAKAAVNLDASGEQRFLCLGAEPAGRLLVTGGKTMRKEYDFSTGKRGAKVPTPKVPTPKGKTRITIRLDDNVLEWFKDQVDNAGGGNYQSLINDALTDHIKRVNEPLEKTLRRVLREELRKAG
jgi:uncharacterized protein (DUF4415 family)